MLDEAKQQQIQVVKMQDHGAIDRVTRCMPISRVIDPATELTMMTDEIFEPIMPIVP